MKLYHATTRERAESIMSAGFLMSKADPAAKIKGCWFASKSNRAWGVLHTIRKHKAQLADVVVIEVSIPKSQLTRFRTGLYVVKADVAASRIRGIVEGSTFGASASE